MKKNQKNSKQKKENKKKGSKPFLLWISTHKAITAAIATSVLAGATLGTLAGVGVFTPKGGNTSQKHWYEYTEEERWWEHCSSGTSEAATEEDVGKTVKVTINGMEHEIRLIGVDHLEPEENAGDAQAHCTFEFVNFISDSNGYSLATFWQDTSDAGTANHNYLDSSIRSALNGNSNGGSTKAINWFQKGETEFSSSYLGSVLSMLPTELSDAIVPVTKKVNINDGGWSETDCTDKLFLLNPKEMGYDSSVVESNVNTYKYYESHTSFTDPFRIKKQVKGSEGAIYDSTTVTSGEYGGNDKYSYAGYNSSNANEGGISWLRSPFKSFDDYASFAGHNGSTPFNEVNKYAYAVAPAFCI